MPNVRKGKTSCKHDPRQFKDMPIGMYHCPDCLMMVLAGLKHPTDRMCKEIDPHWKPPVYVRFDNANN